MRRVAAILIVVFLVCPLLFAALMTLSFSTWTFDRGFYLALLDDARLYQVPDAVSSASWSEQVIDGTGGLRWRSLGRAAGVVVTPEYARGQALSVVNQVFDILDGRARTRDVTIDVAPVKAALLRVDTGRRFARLLAEDLPVNGSAAGFTVMPGRLPVSRPSSISVERAAALIQTGLPVFVSSIPDVVRLGNEPTVPVGHSRWGGGPRMPIAGFLFLADAILLLLAVGFAVAAAFVGGATRFERLQWLGWSLLAPAAGVLLTGLIVVLSFFAPWVQWGIEHVRLEIQGFSPGFISAVIDVARHALSRIGTGFLATGAIGAGVALGLLGWSWSIPQGERKGVPA